MKQLLPILIAMTSLTVATAGCATDLSSRLPRSESISFDPSDTNVSGKALAASNTGLDSKLRNASLTQDGSGNSFVPPTQAAPPKAALDTATKTRPSELNFTLTPTQWQGITRAQIRQQALDLHPAVAQAQANYDALKGKHQQAGLPPNPTAGIVGSDINEAGTAGRYGVFFGREMVRGNKLAADQNVVCAELQSAHHRLEIIQRRLLTDVDQFYYEVLIAQQQLALAKQLEKISAQAVEISQSLYEAQEVPKTSVLQTTMELQKAQMATRRFEATHLSATRKLAAVIGEERLPTQHVAGNVRDIAAIQDFETAYDRLLRDSPELSKMFADIEASKQQLVRDRLEPISNVTWQTSFMYDFVTDDIIGGFQVGWVIPKFDRNQGAIYESSQRIVEAQRRVETKALHLRRRLAEAYEQYLDAQIQVQTYQDQILPTAVQTVELLMKGYQAGETEVLELLVSQRTLFQTNLSYLQNLRILWQQTATIEGLLLDDGLADQ